LDEFYCYIYLLSKKFPKQHRFGIYAKLENTYFNTLEIVIESWFEIKNTKQNLLKSARIKTEVLKRLIRNMAQLNIINQKDYLDSEFMLQEISKMINGWINYLNK